jgi:DNA-binding PadR family transcriptional regulator
VGHAGRRTAGPHLWVAAIIRHRGAEHARPGLSRKLATEWRHSLARHTIVDASRRGGNQRHKRRTHQGVDTRVRRAYYTAVRYSAERHTRLGDLGRFSEPALVILIALAEGPKHGYAIMEEAARLADVRLGPGTLYAALARLERLQLIEALPAVDRRRPYQLTASGASALRAELDSLRQLASAGLARLGALA